MISLQPTEEQQMIIGAVKRFAEKEMRAIYRECDEDGEVPEGIIAKGWEIGLIPGGIPEAYAGFGESHSALTGVLYAEELAWGDLAIALHLLTPALAAFPILYCGTTEQKETYLPSFCDVQIPKATAALVEPRIQFDPNELATVAVVDGDEYVLNGAKAFVPLAADADLFLVYAAENGATEAFLVERGTQGLEVGAREKSMGIKALAMYRLSLDDCRIPRKNRLGGEQGCDFSKVLAHSRVATSALALGVARASYEYALAYAQERQAFGEPIAARQAIAFMLAEMAIDIDAARLMVWEAAWRLDGGKAAAKEAYLAKLFTDDMVMRVTDGGVQVLGGHGYIREFPVELWFRNGRGFATFEGLAMA
jgi:acyl-CoA dehydrogenase